MREAAADASRQTAKVRAVRRELGAGASTEGSGPERAAASTERSSWPRMALSVRSPGRDFRRPVNRSPVNRRVGQSRFQPTFEVAKPFSGRSFSDYSQLACLGQARPRNVPPFSRPRKGAPRHCRPLRPAERDGTNCAEQLRTGACRDSRLENTLGPQVALRTIPRGASAAYRPQAGNFQRIPPDFVPLSKPGRRERSSSSPAPIHPAPSMHGTARAHRQSREVRGHA